MTKKKKKKNINEINAYKQKIEKVTLISQVEIQSKILHKTGTI